MSALWQTFRARGELFQVPSIGKGPSARQLQRTLQSFLQRGQAGRHKFSGFHQALQGAIARTRWDERYHLRAAIEGKCRRFNSPFDAFLSVHKWRLYQHEAAHINSAVSQEAGGAAEIV